jgi:hypothetical protein
VHLLLIFLESNIKTAIKNKLYGAGGMAQVLEPSKLEALSSNPSTTKNKPKCMDIKIYQIFKS